MKLAFPQVAHAATRTSLGESLCNKNYTARSLGTSLLRRSPLVSYHQHRSRSLCAKRHSSNAAAPQLKKSNTNTNEPQKSTPISISDQVRLLMRRVPYPVAIITATDPSGPADTSSFRGMTVSSFSTVTLTPHPVISFNVRRPSETLNALLASGRFLVHLLAPGPATATLARDFSKGNTTLAAMLSGHGEFEFVALDAGAEGDQRPLPVLRRRGEALAFEQKSADFPFVFECELHPSKIEVHDHSIVLGTIVRTIEGSDSVASDLDEQSPDRLCLTYANTKFWKMGSEV
ncbi:FMN-binding split barrel-like protein [Penicillium nucicola]|uniref:FMN-binding split barrel-like protein n=1 Tax=Penicillium nucicola TaxID=1850975 RepID=UPI0025451E8E|nr:FMN-binding split barrel-like protein [Penicillium nucicola]KAJ5769922.1 FMN-binding split barrel-like protein [Penicillium nucicola]